MHSTGEKRLHVLMQKVHTIRNDKNKKRKEAHAQSLQEQAKRNAKKQGTLDEVSLSPPPALLHCSMPTLCFLASLCDCLLCFPLLPLSFLSGLTAGCPSKQKLNED